MKKKSQITVFIILGIAVIIIVSLILYKINISQKKEFDAEINTEINPYKIRSIVEGYVESCLQDAFIRSKTFYGVSPDSSINHEKYITKLMGYCLNTEDIKDYGLDINAKDYSTEVEISDYNINIIFYFPFVIKTDGISIEFENFEYNLGKMTVVEIEQENAGFTVQENLIISNDKSVVINIPENTKITDEAGNPKKIDELTIKMLSFDTQAYEVESFGKTFYEFGPAETYFEPEITVIFKYPKRFVLANQYRQINMKFCNYQKQNCTGVTTEKDIEKDLLITKVKYFP